MTPPADPRAAARWPRLLLLAALLLGIAAMHTLGHPAQAHAPTPTTPATTPRATGEDALPATSVAHHSPARPQAPAQAQTRTQGSTQAQAQALVARTDSPHHASATAAFPGAADTRALTHALAQTGTGTGMDMDMDMDPMSLCLAVLAGLGAVFALGVGRRAGVGRGGVGGRAAAQVRWTHPESPPPRKTLVKLVALRV
ncbi:hypothetical protein ACWCQL_33360 [Streptomyces sp. NPDC002073]